MRIAAILGLVLVGCGGASDSDLFAAPSGSTNDVDASVLDSGKNNPDGNNPGKDTGLPDSNVGAPDVNQPDTFVPPSSTIQCGNNMCDPANTVCCRSGQQPQFKYACVANANQCNGQNAIVLECSKAANCSTMGDVCCANLQQQGQTAVATDTQCVPSNQCQVNNGTVIVCDPAAPNACPNGGSCQQSQFSLPGYNICR